MPAPFPVALRCVPTLVVKQAVDSIVTLNRPDHSTGLKVEVSEWPFMSTKQLTTLHVCGQNTDGTALMLRVADAEPVTRQEYEEGWHRTIEWSYLQNLKHNSHLMFIFQAALNSSGCDCPLLFPPLSLQIREPIDDETTFENGDWNHWEVASDMRPGDVILRNGILISDSANKPAGVLLVKVFTNLAVGRTYDFRVSVRRRNNVEPVPVLSLDTGSESVTEPTPVDQRSWQILFGTFVATEQNTTLRVKTYASGNDGNDFEIDSIHVREL